MVKIDEVAHAAGVSISTVSYALSGKRPVATDTRLRIETAVRELGYTPNAGARMLAGSRTHIFALTEPLRTDTHAPTHMAFVLATSIAARRQGYDILLLTDEEAQAGMRRVTSTGLVDAIIVLDVAPDDPRADLARSIGTPTIFIGVPTDHEGLVCVDLDFEAAGRMAIDAVADAGHRRVGFVGQAEVAYEKSNFPPRLRDGMIARAGERGVALDVRSSGRVVSDPAVARAAAADMLDAGATALLLHCVTEAHAAVLDEVAARDLTVPADVSLVAVGASFDTAAMPVAVDTIPLVPQASCDLAVELAVRSLGAERPEPDLFLIPPTYLSHSSVARPRA